jgi:hypothetical protein
MFLRYINFEKLKNHQESIFLVVCIMLVGLIGFGLGRLSAQYQTSELNINSTLVNTADLDKIITSKPNSESFSENKNIESAPTGAVSRAVVNKKVVGNKNSKIYHYEDCPGALRMSEANKVFFTSVPEAQQAGSPGTPLRAA